MNIKDFYKKLQSHDWYFSFSDDGSVYRQGLAQRNELLKLTETSAQHKVLYEDFIGYMFHNNHLETKAPPIPQIPEEGAPIFDYGPPPTTDEEIPF